MTAAFCICCQAAMAQQVQETPTAPEEPTDGWRQSPLHATLGAWVTVGLGHDSFTAFGQSLSLDYAVNLTPKLTFAAEGFMSRLSGSGMSCGNAGISAALAYRFDEHWEGMVYAQKSFATGNPTIWSGDANAIGDKIGVEVRYHFNPSFSIGVSVWRQSTDAAYPFLPPSLSQPFSSADYSAPR